MPFGEPGHLLEEKVYGNLELSGTAEGQYAITRYLTIRGDVVGLHFVPWRCH